MNYRTEKKKSLFIFPLLFSCILILFSILCCTIEAAQTPLFQENNLLHRIKKAQQPLFVLYSAQQHFYLLILSPTETRKKIIFVEATKDTLEREQLSSWADWITIGMPNSLSKHSFEFDFERNLLLYEEKLSSFILLFLQFFTSPYVPIPLQERRKIGSSPSNGEPDRRALWNPPSVFESKKRDYVPSEAYSFLLTSGPTELLGKACILYFEKASNSTSPPFEVFPNWIESKGRLLFIAKPVESGILPSTL